MTDNIGAGTSDMPALGKSAAAWLFSLDSRRALCVCALLAAVFYIVCSTPQTGFRDGPEFSVTASCLDIAHPAGFPLYSLTAKAATWIPFGSIGFRVTMFTAFAGALSLLMMALLLIRLHNLERGLPPALPWLLSPILIFALDKAVFVSSSELEVYSLHTFFVLLLLFCAVKWHDGSGVKWLYAGGFLYGLSAGNHGSMCLYLPVLLILTFWGEPPGENDGKKIRHLKRLGLLILFFLIGLSVYLYLIIRANASNLPVNFGYPHNWGRFWTHITDAKDADYHFKALSSPEEFIALLKVQFSNLCSPLFFPALPFFAWGLRFLWKKFQILSVALVLLILTNLSFFYYWIDGSAAFIPSIAAFAVLSALGLGEFGRHINKKKLLKLIVSAAAAAVVLLTVITMGKARISERETVSGYQYIELFYPDLSRVPPESIIVHHAGWLSLVSLQNVYGARPDLTLMLMGGLMAPSYMNYPRPDAMPLAHFPLNEAGGLISPFMPDYNSLFFTTNLERGKRIFIQYGEEAEIYFDYMEPVAYLMWMGELKSDPAAGWNALQDGSYDKFFNRARNYIRLIKSDRSAPLAPKLPTFLFYFLGPVLVFAFDHDLYGITDETLKTYLDSFDCDGCRLLTPDLTFTGYALYANTLRRIGKYNEAEKAAERLIAIRPYFSVSHEILGLIYNGQNRGPEAIREFKMAVELYPYSPPLFQRLFYASAKYQSMSEALSLIDAQIALLDKEGLQNTKAILEYVKACFLLDPGLDELPAGNLHLERYNRSTGYNPEEEANPAP
jgi:tetratricopeptide (TPR) repeat protein